MYEEGNRKLSLDWGSLLIKLGILAVIVFVVCWLFTLVTGKKNDKSATSLALSNSEYITNVNGMKDAATEYFTSSTLPEKVGESKKLTLEEMINQKLMIDFTDDGKTCDLNSSYVQATKTADGNYALKVALTCDKKSDFIVTTIEKKNVVINNITNNNTTNNSGNSNNNSGNNNGSTTVKPTTPPKTTTITIKYVGTCVDCKPTETPSKTRYYKLIKYSSWASGYSNASNAENKRQEVVTEEYCPIQTKTYYSSGYITEGTGQTSYDYTVQLKDMDPSDIAYIRLDSSSRFNNNTNTDYKNYLNQRYQNLHMVGNNYKSEVYVNTVAEMKNSSLKSSNFTFNVGKITLDRYNDVYNTTITINYRNSYGINPYYSTNIKQYVYFVPLKFNVSYAKYEDCIRDTADNWENYSNHIVLNNSQETRYIWTHRTYETKWSTEKNVSGWEYTGTYEDR